VNRYGTTSELVRRLLACLGAGVMLALMVGQQQGSQNDYGLGFRESVLDVRIIWFLLIGVLLFLMITFRSVVTPYVRRPGVRPLVIGLLVLIATFFLMHWYDPANSAKFTTLGDLVAATPQLSPLAHAFFGWLWWVSLLVLVVGTFLAIAVRLRVLGWVTAAVSVVVGIMALLAHQSVVSFAAKPDHSLGAEVAFIGYLVIALAGVIAATARVEQARTREFVERVMAFRPGLPLVALGLVLGVLALAAGGRACRRGPPDGIILDMDSSESPTFGQQEGSGM
jgi:hypothetical protein